MWFVTERERANTRLLSGQRSASPQNRRISRRVGETKDLYEVVRENRDVSLRAQSLLSCERRPSQRASGTPVHLITPHDGIQPTSARARVLQGVWRRDAPR